MDREPDPSLWRARFTVRVGASVPKPGTPNPEPGKPYRLTAAQRVKIPKGLSRKQEAEFLLRDLEEALAYEPTAEELGESVIDLTGDVTSQSAPTVSEPSPIAPRQIISASERTRSTAGRSGVVAIDLRVTEHGDRNGRCGLRLNGSGNRRIVEPQPIKKRFIV